jgi:signal peptidase I
MEKDIIKENTDVIEEQVISESNNMEECNDETAEYIDDFDESVYKEATNKLNESKQARKKEFISWVLTFTSAIVVFAILFVFFAPGVVSGSSMQPNYWEDDRFIMVRDWVLSDYEYGDVVCVNIQGRLLIKRLIGKPGDYIKIEGDVLYRNGEKVVEPYINQGTYNIEPQFGDIILGENEYYVLGDNRGGSMDSRMIGPVTDIAGKAVFYFRSVWFQKN